MQYNKILLIGVINLLLLIVLPGKLKAQGVNEFQYRTDFELDYKITKKLKINFTPQLRFDNDFSLDKFHLETGLSYKPGKVLRLGASYRFIANQRSNSPTELSHRFALQASLKKKLNRFEPSFRLKYTNYTEDKTDGNFLRYKGKVAYNIRKSKLEPSVDIEAFQALGNTGMYKIRYGAGLDYKLSKNSFIQTSYKLDYYLKEVLNKHIFSIGYKLKF